MEKSSRITVEKAQELLKEIPENGKTEVIPLFQALGRICAKDIYASMNQPPFSRSPLDGYAVQSEDVKAASGENPAVLKVTQCIYAGDSPKSAVYPGEAARIMTGAPIPDGADAVVMQEKTDEGTDTVQIYTSVKAYQNYCFCGEDISQGALLIKKGDCFAYSGIGVLAGQGILEVLVYTQLTVGIMATGSELAEAGEALKPGQIYDSNGPLLAFRIMELGMKPVLAERGIDEVESLAEKLDGLMKQCDIVITSGGVSVGERDCMPEVAQVLGAEILFHGISAKPGSPMMVMKKNGSYAVCLSGNPFAAAATFEILVRPVLERMKGRTDWTPFRLKGVMESAYPHPSPLKRFIRGRIRDGKVWVPEKKNSPGMLSSFTECNCLVDIPAGNIGLEQGQGVEVILL